MENQQLVPPSRQCSGTPVGFLQGFLAKNNVTTLKHPLPTFQTWFKLYFTRSLEYNQHWMDRTLMILLTSCSMGRQSLEGLHKMASGNVSDTFAVAATSIFVQRECFLRKCNLNYLDVLYYQKWSDSSKNFVSNLTCSSSVVDHPKLFWSNHIETVNRGELSEVSF
jgi:hypothetical protein